MAEGKKSTLRARPALERIMRIHQAVLNGERPTASSHLALGQTGCQ